LCEGKENELRMIERAPLDNLDERCNACCGRQWIETSPLLFEM